MSRRVAACARYSSSAQKVTSIADQLRDIRKLVEQEGDTLDEVFVFADEAVSGTTEAGRGKRPGRPRGWSLSSLRYLLMNRRP